MRSAHIGFQLLFLNDHIMKIAIVQLSMHTEGISIIFTSLTDTMHTYLVFVNQCGLEYRHHIVPEHQVICGQDILSDILEGVFSPPLTVEYPPL